MPFKSTAPEVAINLINIATGKFLENLTGTTTRDVPTCVLEDPVNVSSDPKSSQQFFSSGAYSKYQSPLLRFRSYRLNPLYRTQFKLPLSSLSFSHRIDPHKIICRYELQGKCHDPSCAAQHLKSASLSTDELVGNLLAYAKDVKLDYPIDSYRNKMKDSEILPLAAHAVYKQLVKQGQQDIVSTTEGLMALSDLDNNSNSDKDTKAGTSVPTGYRECVVTSGPSLSLPTDTHERLVSWGGLVTK